MGTSTQGEREGERERGTFYRRAIATAIYLLFTHDYENDSGCGGVICSTVSGMYRVFAQQNRHHGEDVI